MPPRQLPRVTFTWRCPSCRTSSLTRPRSSTTTLPKKSSLEFSTLRPLCATSPLSPTYFDIPEPAQQDAIRPSRAKGTLPIPHDVFHSKKGGLGRADIQNIKPNMPPRTRERGPYMREHVAKEQWKLKMAASRGQNLQSGLSELKKRRVKTLGAKEFRNMRQVQQKQARLTQAAQRREEAHLTAPSVTATMQTLKGTTLPPDPNHEQLVATSKQNVQRQEEIATQKRADAMHELYMRARNFIVSEEQLNEVIDREFGSEGQERVFGARGIGIWEQLKSPDTIRKLAHQANVRAGVAQGGPVDVNAQLSQRRLKKIAEEMTGGKM